MIGSCSIKHLIGGSNLGTSLGIALSGLLASSELGLAESISPLAQYAGSWAVKPELCGKIPELDRDFPYVISKDGKRIADYETKCVVAKASKISEGQYKVRLSCEMEGEPYVTTINYKFKDKTLRVAPEGATEGTLFHQCAAPAATKKKKPTPGIVKSSLLGPFCRMDSCGFIKFGAVKSRKKTPSGELVIINYQAASVDAPQVDGQADQHADVKVPAFGNVPNSVSVVHCSKRRPFEAVQMDSTSWQAQLFNFPDDLMPTYRQRSFRFYMAVCHGKNLNDEDLIVQAKRMSQLGYGNQWSGDNDLLQLPSIDDVKAFSEL